MAKEGVCLVMLPSDVLGCVFEHLDLSELASATAVCREWHEAGSCATTMALAAANSTIRLTHTQMVRAFGLPSIELATLPAKPYVSLRGYTCWLYDSMAVAQALKRLKAGGDGRVCRSSRRARRRMLLQPYCARLQA